MRFHCQRDCFGLNGCKKRRERSDALKTVFG